MGRKNGRWNGGASFLPRGKLKHCTKQKDLQAVVVVREGMDVGGVVVVIDGEEEQRGIEIGTEIGTIGENEIGAGIGTEIGELIEKEERTISTIIHILIKEVTKDRNALMATVPIPTSITILRHIFTIDFRSMAVVALVHQEVGNRVIGKTMHGMAGIFLKVEVVVLGGQVEAVGAVQDQIGVEEEEALDGRRIAMALLVDQPKKGNATRK